MRYLEFDVGDKAWIHLGSRQYGARIKWTPFPKAYVAFASTENPLTEGEVVLKFQHGHQTLYVLEVDTGIDPTYEVREGLSMSDDPKKPIGLWRRDA